MLRFDLCSHNLTLGIVDLKKENQPRVLFFCITSKPSKSI